MSALIKTRVAMTYEESSPGVPFWGANAVTTDLLPDQVDIAIENLVAGRKYYVKTWNEDQFGTKSLDVIRTIHTPIPTRQTLLSLSAQGVLDSGSPMYAYVKIPSSVKSVVEALVTLSFRQFMAPAKSAVGSGALTSDSGGGATSGASSATSSGASSNSTTNTDGFPYGFSVPGHSHGGGADAVWTGLVSQILTYLPTSDHTHGMAHTHGIAHNHTTPDHAHSVPTHVHALVYGTFEEAMPATHSVTAKTYERVFGAWVLRSTSAALTGALVDLVLTSVIKGPGDWRIQVQSAAAQPNDGRLSCDIFGSITVTI